MEYTNYIPLKLIDKKLLILLLFINLFFQK